MASESPISPNDLVMDKADDIALQPRGYQQTDLDLANLNLSEATEDSTDYAIELAKDTQRQCQLLLEELEQFQAHLKLHKKEHAAELRPFKSGVQAELKLLNKLCSTDPTTPKTNHNLQSSNFSFYAAIWSKAKASNGLKALSKRFYWKPEKGKATKPYKRMMYSAMVDIVSEDGLEWMKVSSITEKRIIWDLAKAGWVDSSSDESENDDHGSSSEDDDPQGLVKQARDLVKAAAATRVRYRHPKVRIVLPRIKAQPDSPQVGKVLQKIRDLGVTVQTMEEVSLDTIPISSVLDRLTPDQFLHISSVLNVDCTLLLAFASDLSHGRVEPEDWHNPWISHQIRAENEDQLLPISLWPICGGRKLVCTHEAAVRMQEIIDIIGTETEKRRALLMLYSNPSSPLSRSEILSEFQKLSDYPIPSDWQIPIEVIDEPTSSLLSKLPPVADLVSEKLTDINRSVFLYGWANGRTTVSSNRTTAREVEHIIESNREEGGDVIGPEIWLSPVSRSLVGKEKQRRGAVGDD